MFGGVVPSSACCGLDGSGFFFFLSLAVYS